MSTRQFPALTDRQRQVLEYIEERIQALGYPPTIREIGAHMGIRSTNGVADHLKALTRKGYLTHKNMKSRTLMPVSLLNSAPWRADASPASQSDAVALPLLGRVAAGEPILAEENAEGTVVVDRALVGSGGTVFALRVVGDSMIEAGILDSDFIFVRKRSQAAPGDIVVVIIENEATLKRYYPEGEQVRLQPANSRMEPLVVRMCDFRDIQIIGVVIGVYRKLPVS